MRTGVAANKVLASTRYGCDGSTTNRARSSVTAGCDRAMPATARHHSAVRARPKYIFRLTPIVRADI
jgi:hypothetical protein